MLCLVKWEHFGEMNMGRTGNKIENLEHRIDGLEAENLEVRFEQLQAQVNRLESCRTHSNLRIHMIEEWITGQSEQPSAMVALVQYIKAIVPPTELEQILKGEVSPPEAAD